MNFETINTLLSQIVIYIDTIVGGNEFASGAIIAGLLGMVTFAASSWPRSIINFIIKHTTTSLELNSTNESYHFLSKYLHNKDITSQSRFLKVGNGKYGADSCLKELGYGNQVIWWNWYTPLLISASKSDSVAQQVKEFITIKKLGRSHAFFDTLIGGLKEENDDAEMTKFYKYKNDFKQLLVSQKKRPLDSIAIPNIKLNQLKNTINTFVSKEEWYVKHQIPYQLGILLYGPPGTGKTSLIKAIACYMDKNICYVDNEISLIGALTEVTDSIIVMEEVDTLCLAKRGENDSDKNLETESDDIQFVDAMGKHVLGKVLNALDGVISNHGRVTIMTTNHETSLDSALIRPGRIDLQLKLDFVCSETFNFLLNRFYKHEHEPRIFHIKDKVTPATIQSDLILEMSYEDLISKYTNDHK